MKALSRAIHRWFAASYIPRDLAAGDLCSVIHSENRFRVLKVLKVDPRIIHIRSYKQTFPRRPVHVNTATLTLGTIHDPDGFGMGHIPLSRPAFGGMVPIVFQHEPVTEDELGGYHLWEKYQGGTWD